MINSIKKAFSALYILYYEKVPLEKGKYFFGRTLYNIFGYAVYSFDGIKMLLNPLSLIDRKIIQGEDHDPEVKKLIDNELNDGGLFIDVGANIGYFSLLAAVKKNVEVIAFEPSPRERKRLYENVALNDFNNVVIYPFALSDKPQKLALGIARDWNPGLNSFVNNLGSEQVNSIEVSCYSFDEIITAQMARRIKLIKIDVEGYEMVVLKGMKGSMDNLKQAKFILEINTKFLEKAGSSVKEIYDFFASHGFNGEKGMSERTYDETFYKVS